MGVTYRLLPVYRGLIFRAEVNYKNVQKGEKWTEGSMFFDSDRNFCIAEKTKSGDYSLKYVYTEKIWTDTFFRAGNGADIFENDILRLTYFSLPPDFEMIDSETEIMFNNDECDHPLYIAPPLASKRIYEINGVVCFYSGVPCIHFFNQQDGLYYLTPLAYFFDNNGFPIENLAVEVIGNTSDNIELCEKILKQTALV